MELGDEGVNVYNAFKFEETEVDKYDVVLKKFEDHCTPRRNEVFERYKFFTTSQQEGQTVDNYITKLKTLAAACEFGDQEDSLIRDRVVLGIREDGLQERLLREKDLTLQKAIEFVRAAETTKEQFRSMKGLPNSVDIIKTASKNNKNYDNHRNQVKNKNYKKEDKNSYDCKKCGKNHRRAECPAYGKQCSKCKKKNHFAVGCRKQNIQEIECKSSDEIFVEAVSQVSNRTNEKSWHKNVQIQLNNRDSFSVNFKLDTGAETNVLPYSVLKSYNVNLVSTDTVLVAYGDFKLQPKGKISLECIVNNAKVNVEFFVIDKSCTPILGLMACIKLKLIQRVDAVSITNKDDVLNQYHNVFEGIGKFPGSEYRIELKPNACPVIHPPRRVPQALQQRLKETLDRLESSEIITKVNKPTDWVQSLVIVEKPNGSLRLCLDPRDLNKVLKREHHLIPSAEDIISRLEGKKLFSVLDLKDGFWQVPLDSESSEICTFNTPFGRYKFNRMPFGIASAPEVFQKRNERLFGDIEGVEVYFDDIIVTGIDEVAHDKALLEVLNPLNAELFGLN